MQKTVIPGFHFGEPDYWYAFAGDPAAGSAAAHRPALHRHRRLARSWTTIVWLADIGHHHRLRAEPVLPHRPGHARSDGARSWPARWTCRRPGTDYFADDDGTAHEDNINRVAAARHRPPAAATPTSAPPTRSRARSWPASWRAALDLPATTHRLLHRRRPAAPTRTPSTASPPPASPPAAAPARFCPNGIVIRQVLAAFF